MGYPIKGHVIAYRSGHPLNMKLLQKLKEQEESLLYWGVVAEEQIHDVQEMNLEQVKRILPHRDPFLFVDRIIAFEPGRRAVGIKECHKDDYYFKGHFPKRPIMPGVLIVEAMAQVAGIVILNKKENFQKYAYFIAMDNVRFRKAVVPGDQLIVEIVMTRQRSHS